MGKLVQKIKRKKAKNRVISAISTILVACLITALCPMIVLPQGISDSADYNSAGRADSYAAYLAKYNDAEAINTTIDVDVTDFTTQNSEVSLLENYEGFEERCLYFPESAKITWNVEVQQAGLYCIKMVYYTAKGKGTDIQRKLYINDEIPFYNANYFSFSRLFRNENDTIEQDKRGNDLRPAQIEVHTWKTDYFCDYLGFEQDAYKFYFHAGENSITMEATSEPMVIGSLMLCQQQETASYAETQAQNSGTEKITGTPITLQGEDASVKSAATLYPVCDRSSPTTVPYSVSKIRLNSIGGSDWKMPYQTITWTVNVEKSGLYRLGIKYRQNTARGKYVSRKLLIDGSVPFTEANKLTFSYNTQWQNMIVSGDGANDAYIYLKSGPHEISLEVTLGDLAEVLSVANDSLYQLNVAYRDILMIIGNSPDKYRDYQLKERIPEAINILGNQSKVLQSLSEQIYELTGQRGSATSTLDTLIMQLNDMYADSTTIQKKWADFESNLSALAAWILNMQEQPLSIDYITLLTEDSSMPKAKANPIQWLWHEARALTSSFFEDYSSIGDVSDSASLSVWVQSGRDQAQIIKTLIDNEFTPNNNIQINVKQVSSGVLLPSIISGKSPDIALQMGNSEPVDYAVRKAAYDLSKFEDCDEIMKQFMESAITPFRFNGGVYALPETQIFPVMFYRSDILKDLGLSVPETWDDFYKVLQIIQKKNMDTCLGTTVSSLTGYTMFLYQNGGNLYEGNGVCSALNSETAISAFKTWTNFYVDYGLPLSYSFINRFRTGEMPIGITDYTNYSYLSVFAPEIRGLWSIAKVPGTMQEDGTVDHSVASSSTGCIILSSTKSPEKAWKFLKWWTSSDIQYRYGMELEGQLGVSARYATANIAALERLPWTSDELNIITDQKNWVKGIQEVPGGYFTGRHLDNAFRQVVYHSADPRETLSEYASTIDGELTNKRSEFGLLSNEK